MFDSVTSALIRQAPRIEGVDPEALPQDLTRAYAELVALRLRRGEPGAEAARELQHDRLLKMAAVYEALVDTLTDPTHRRGAAFVAGTAYQILGRTGIMEAGRPEDLLSPASIHPDIAAPLLFLISGQSPDAREAARRLRGARGPNVLISAMVETIADLAAENFDTILTRAERLRELRPAVYVSFTDQATQALYGLCWAGVVRMVAGILDRYPPLSQFRQFETPDQAFLRVEELSVEDIQLAGEGAQLVSTYAGPRHLARLLRYVSTGIVGTGIANLRTPSGTNDAMWRQWLGHRAKSKPVIWPNHRPAIDAGILEAGTSSVLVLPTGAGKTTLAELKIAATVSSGRKVIFLVPTLALVDQLRDDLAASFPSDIGNIEVSAEGDLAVLAQGPELSAIEVMTPERFLALLSFAEADISDLGLIVFDECHLLSPTGGGSRSVDAMLSVLHAAKRAPDADFLFLSAMLTNGQELAGWVGQLTGRRAVYFNDEWKPSRQARGIVLYPRTELAPINDYIRRRRVNPNLRPPAFSVTAYALFGLQQNWAPQAPADTKIIRLIEEPVQIKAGTYGPAPNANDVAASIAAHAAATKLKTIVFVQQASHAPSTAKKLAGRVRRVETITATEQGYLDDLTVELGSSARSLVNAADGAVPHNGDMLPLERRLAESLFRRSDGADVIVATPTLAQGINLPTQLAILAGNKRHDDAGREDLQSHEILNAAGRAGRAGYLANGTVILVPEPVVAFHDTRAEAAALDRLRSILPLNDRCVHLDDPLGILLDRIHLGDEGDAVRYLVSRLRGGEAPDQANAAASALMRRSFAAYRASQSGTAAAFEQQMGSLEALLADEAAESVTDALRVSAFTGFSISAVTAISQRLGEPMAFPNSVPGWVDWIVDFLRDEPVARENLFGGDSSILRTVVRGKKTGGDLRPAEFETLRRGMHAWVDGRTLQDIEAALGVEARKIKCCSRARDLVLKVINRTLYMISAAVAELAKSKYIEAAALDPNPAVLETLAYAIRAGLDIPEKVAFSYLRPKIRTRVGLHRTYDRVFAERPAHPGGTFRAVLNHVTALLAFAPVGEEQ